MRTSSPTRHVALLVETSNAYARGLLAGIRSFAAERPRWSLYLAEHSRLETDYSWLEGWRGHGVLARVETTGTAEVIRALDLPTVDLSAKRLMPELPIVETDDRQIAAWAVEHFARLGLREFAYCGDERYGWSLARGDAFAEEAARRGTVAHTFALDASGRRSSERERLALWVRRLPHPIGLLACYDVAGQEVLEACKIAGVRVPDEVAVLGVDNDELFCTLTSPQLSSIEPDAARTGFLAAELLDHMMAGRPQAPGLRPIPPRRIATRQSTDLVSVDDPLAAAAMRFIRDRSDTAILVESVLRHVGLSRRALDLRLTKLLGRTVHGEIVRARIARVAELLTTTDWTLPRIAEELDFPHAEYMGVMFKRELGTSPGAYRRAAEGRVSRQSVSPRSIDAP
ncbi:XylR family transcriptional regulator [Agromyces silvae]|uniref:XylR family transcriptional regulator n=1 Tax=Agromyces silvae TaxID=3388266 RepID=UPI00280B26A3|nr:XylR family transcriptional regulator [Agromyces protaetiae]